MNTRRTASMRVEKKQQILGSVTRYAMKLHGVGANEARIIPEYSQAQKIAISFNFDTTAV